MCVTQAFLSSVSFGHLRSLALASVLSEPSPSGDWAVAQGFALTEHARPSHPTESSSLRVLADPALRTGILLPVALHGRITPPQFLSATDILTHARRGLSPRYVVTFTVALSRPCGTDPEPRRFPNAEAIGLFSCVPSGTTSFRRVLMHLA